MGPCSVEEVVISLIANKYCTYQYSWAFSWSSYQGNDFRQWALKSKSKWYFTNHSCSWQSLSLHVMSAGSVIVDSKNKIHKKNVCYACNTLGFSCGQVVFRVMKSDKYFLVI